MGERDRNLIIESKINTLEESLKFFDKSCLLEQLDVNLELTRRGKVTKEHHLDLLKSVDKDLLKLSRFYHPDKVIKENKLDEEVSNAQNQQIALNATRTVLKALTEVFLKDIDIHYKYEFFAKLDVNTLSNEKQIDLEINNVLCKISRLSEVKRMNIVGEIRKFLLKCQKCLESFRHVSSKYDFVRYRENALQHLHNCIEGYEILFMEYKLIMEECRAEKDENTWRVIRNMYEQNLSESKILQDLQEVAKRSLDGTFEIYPIYKPRYNVPVNPMEYETVIPPELEYFVLPFILYVNVLLMCSVMVDKKSRWMKFKTKIGETFEYLIGNYPEEPVVLIKEPALLKAYHLASYFSNKNRNKEQVQIILKGKDLHTDENTIIRNVFKQTMEEIEQLLAKQFDINSYKEGKRNREQFNERLFELNDSMAAFKDVEKNLLEKFELYEQETNEIRKECSEISEKIEKTEEECQEIIRKCKNATENVNEIKCNQNEISRNETFNQNNAHENESYADVNDNHTENKSKKNIEDRYRKLGEHEKIFICSDTDTVSKSTMHHLRSSYQITQIAKDLCYNFPQEHGECSVVNVEKKSSFNRDQFHKISLENLLEHPPSYSQNIPKSMKHQSRSGSQNGYSAVIEANVDKKILKQDSQSDTSILTVSNETTVTDEVQQNIKSNHPSPEYVSSNETSNQIAQMISDQCEGFSQEQEEKSKEDAEENYCFYRAVSEDVHQSIQAKKPFPECIYGKETANKASEIVFDLYSETLQGRYKNSKVNAQEITSFNKAEIEKVQQNLQAKKPLTECISGDRKHQSRSGNQNVYSAVIEANADKIILKQDTQSDTSRLPVSNKTTVTDEVQQNLKSNHPSPEYVSRNETSNKMISDQCQFFSQEQEEKSTEDAEENTCFYRGVSEEVQQTMQAKKPSPECISGKETANKITEMVFDHPETFQSRYKNSKVNAQEITSFNKAESEKVQQNLQAKEPFFECISGDRTASHEVFNQYKEILQGIDKNSEVNAEGIACFKRDQLQKEPINFQMSELFSIEPNKKLPRIYEDCGEYNGEKNSEALKIISDESDDDLPGDWIDISILTAT